MDGWRAMLARVIAPQDFLKFGARFDERSDLHGSDCGQSVCRKPKSRIRGALRRAPRLFGQLLHHSIVAAHEVIRELTAERGEQSADVPETLAQKVKPIQGTQSFPINYPKGGTVSAKMIAGDSTNSSAIAEASLRLEACAK